MLGFRSRLRALSHCAAILKDSFWRKAATHTASRSMAHHPLSLDLRLTRPPRRYPKRNGLMIAMDADRSLGEVTLDAVRLLFSYLSSVDAAREPRTRAL